MTDWVRSRQIMRLELNGPLPVQVTIAMVEEINGFSEVYNVIDTPADETHLSILTASGVDTGLDGGSDGLVDSPFGPVTARRRSMCAYGPRGGLLRLLIPMETTLPSRVICL